MIEGVRCDRSLIAKRTVAFELVLLEIRRHCKVYDNIAYLLTF